MRIVRQRQPDRFTVVDNKVLEDKRLTYRARGVLGYLLSRPDGWQTDSIKLAALSPGEGRDAVRTALDELELVGYIVRQRTQDPKTGRWSTSMVLRDSPTPENPASGVRRLETRPSVNQALSPSTDSNQPPPAPSSGSLDERRPGEPGEEVLPAAVLTAIGSADALCDELRAARSATGLGIARWTNRLIVRSLTAAYDAGCDPALMRDALLALARMPDTKTPGRLRHDGGWWDQAEGATARIRSSRTPIPLRDCQDCTNGWLEDHEGLPIGRCPKCHPAIRGVTA